MNSDDLLRLRAYLDQEEAAIAKIWKETSAEVKEGFLEWAASSAEEKYKLANSGFPSDMEWIDFAARVALWAIQNRMIAGK